MDALPFLECDELGRSLMWTFERSLVDAVSAPKVPAEVLRGLKLAAESTITAVEPDIFLRTVSDEGVPCVDVRSPGEYALGHIPGAVSVPLFTDAERHLIGTTFSRQGKDIAMVLGMKMVKCKLPLFHAEAVRLTSGMARPRLAVHCWRGGMRSRSAAWWFKQAGVNAFTLRGGYRAYRDWNLAHLYSSLGPRVCIVGGRTGSGKTRVLHALTAMGEQVVDLEGLANHRGSSFGWIAQPDQPTSEQFGNDIAKQWMRLDPTRWVYIEVRQQSAA